MCVTTTNEMKSTLSGTSVMMRRPLKWSKPSAAHLKGMNCTTSSARKDKASINNTYGAGSFEPPTLSWFDLTKMTAARVANDKRGNGKLAKLVEAARDIIVKRIL